MSIVLKSVLCFSISGMALFGGAAFASAATGIAAGVSSAVAPGLYAIGGSLLANMTEDAVEAAQKNVHRRLKSQAKGGMLPQNHDLFRAVRRSQLNAMLYLVTSFDFEARTHSGEYENTGKFRKQATKYLKSQLSLADQENLGLTLSELTSETVSEEIRELFAGEQSASQQIEALWTIGREAAWTELKDAIGSSSTWPGQAFRDWFLGSRFDGGYGVGYIDAVQQFFAEKIKTDGRLQAVVFMDHLSEIGSGVSDLLQKISRIDEQLAERFDLLEKLLSENGSELASSDGNGDRLLSEIASAPSLQDIQQTIQALLPSDDDLARLTATVVRQRMSELLYQPLSEKCSIPMPKFFGRESELQSLDEWIDTAERGLRVLCAPSGSGKSALMAAWARRRAEHGDSVVRHFISLDMPDTYTPAVTVRHLLDQLRRIDRLADKSTTMSIVGDDEQLKNTLYGRLCEDQPINGPRLIVIVDGLDELIEPFSSSFVNEGIGDGVYVIVTRRAEPESQPSDLLTWLQAPAGDDISNRRIDLKPMSQDDVLVWLEEIIAEANEVTMRKAAAKLEQITDGIPLFLEYVIDIELSTIAYVPIEERLDRLMALSTPFSGFLKDFIEGRIGVLARNSGLTREQKAHLMIFALIHGPISEMDAQNFHRNLTRSSDLGELRFQRVDTKISRWLSVREATDKSVDPTPRIAFDHPRLALEFRHVLRSIDPQLFEAVEEALWTWSKTAWQPSFDELRSREKRGALYATRHAPMHGLGFRRTEEVAKLLSNQTFIRERFLTFDAADAALLMYLDWNKWSTDGSRPST